MVWWGVCSTWRAAKWPIWDAVCIVFPYTPTLMNSRIWLVRKCQIVYDSSSSDRSTAANNFCSCNNFASSHHTTPSIHHGWLFSYNSMLYLLKKVLLAALHFLDWELWKQNNLKTDGSEIGALPEPLTSWIRWSAIWVINGLGMRHEPLCGIGMANKLDHLKAGKCFCTGSVSCIKPRSVSGFYRSR